MGSIRLRVEGLQGWEDPPRVERLILALPSVEEATVDPSTGQAWVGGRSHLPLLGILEALHRAGYEAEPATETTLFPTLARDEAVAFGRLRASLLWTLFALALDWLAPQNPWVFPTALLLLLVFLFTSARPLWIRSLRSIRRGRWADSPRRALALFLIAASLPVAASAGETIRYSMLPAVVSLLYLSRVLELRWRRSFRRELKDDAAAAGLHSALGKPSGDSRSRGLEGKVLAWVLPIAAATWLGMGVILPEEPSPENLMQGLAAILLAGGSRGMILAASSIMAAGLARAWYRGLRFRSAAFLQEFHRVDALAFDRVGFLTLSQARVETVKILGSDSVDRLYSEAAGALAEAGHPLLRALYRFAAERSDETSRPLSVIRRPGGGLQAEIGGRTLLVGHPWFLEGEKVDMASGLEAIGACEERGLSIVALAEDGRLRAVFGLQVDPRPEAPSILRRIGGLGPDLVLLTGEREELARRDAEALKLQEYRACLGSEDRAKVLRQMMRKGRRVAAIGQGSHDAPVLAAAEFAVAMGKGQPPERAGLWLPSGKPSALLDSLSFSRHCDGLIRQSGWIASALVFASLILAVSGIVGPLGAVALQVLSVQVPLLFSLRTRSFRFES